MCEEQEARTHVMFNKNVVATINEILCHKIKLVTQDLEAFAKYNFFLNLTLQKINVMRCYIHLFIEAWKAHNNQWR